MNTLPTSRQLAIFVVLSLPSLVLSPSLYAQSDTISTTINTDAEQLIREVFFGASQCFEAFNFELNGEPAQSGTFTNGTTSIGFESGVVLSNGDIRDISGPNLGYLLNDADASTGYDNEITDPDLEILSNLEGQNNPFFWDVVILEFDFTPTLDTVSFDYVFASEEYCDFTASSFIDLFGFFISGPGINGPFTDDAINLAQVPGTNQSITAGNINQIFNAAYYNNNIPPGQLGCSFGQAAPNADFIAFDGYTVPLTASTPVIPCETYHLKLVVADRGPDSELDAAVFLKANSFAAGLTSRIASEVNGPNQGDNSPYEGCGFTSIIFTRGDSIITNDLVIRYDILPNSTATPGLDYMALPDSVIIPAGQFADTINLDFFADNIAEGTEFFTIKLRNPCDCSESELTINILEPPPVSGAIVGTDRICEGEAFSLAAVPSGGIGEFSYEWTNGDMDSLFNFVPSVTDTYEVIISDECGTSDTIQQIVRVQAPSGSIDGDIVLCDGRLPEDLVIVLNDGDVFSFDLLQNDNPTSFSNISADTFFLPVSSTGVYQISNLSADGCSGSVEGEAQVLSVTIDTDITIDSIACYSDADAAITLAPAGGTGVYHYIWEHDELLDTNTINGLDIGTYSAFISDSNGCVDTISVDISQPPLLEVMIDTINLVADCASGGALEGNASGGLGAYTLNWSGGATSNLVNDLVPGSYTLEVTDANGCTAQESATILADTLSPIVQLTALDTLDCFTTSVQLDAGGSSTGPNFTYQWTAPNGVIINPTDSVLFDVSEAGIYTLRINNIDNSCSKTDSLEVVQEDNNLVVNIGGHTDLSCLQTAGEIYFIDSMPDFSTTWQLLDETILAVDVNSLTVVNPGTYVLIARQLSTGCIGTDTIVVDANADPPILSLANSPDSLDCDINQVTLDVNIANGSGDYSYNWDGPVNGIVGDNTTQDVVGSLPGLYQLIAIDNDSGCQDTLNYEIIQNQVDLLINPLPDTVLSCAITEINYSASSPNTGNLQYEWFDEMGNSIALSPNVLLTATGIYTLQLTDLDNNCSQVASLQVRADTLAPATNALLPEQLTCASDSVELAVEPGPDNYSLHWRTAMGEVLPSETWTQMVGASGGYILTVTDDNNGCRSSVIFEVFSDTIAPEFTFELADTLSCTRGEVELRIDSIVGSGTYTYQWEGPVGGINGATDQASVITVAPGSYNLLLTDNQNSCESAQQIVVESDQLAPSITPLNDTLLNCYNPEILLSASSNDTGDLIFEWFDAQNVSIIQAADLLITEEGSYRVVLTNADNGCFSELNISVSEDFIAPSANAGEDATIDCINNMVILNGTEGNSNWIPTWLDENGTILSSGDWVFNATEVGNYTLQVLDTINGCEAFDTAEVQVDQNTPLAVVTLQNTIDCFSGVASIDATGSSEGTGFSYRIEDENGSILTQPTTLNFEITTPGSYQWIVTDIGNNCEQAIDFVVDETEPSISSLALNDIPCGASSGSIVFSEVIGGTPPYLYSIDDGNTFSTAAIFSILSAGTYNLVVQDANGCETSSSAFIEAAIGVELNLPEQVKLDFLAPYTLNPIIRNVDPSRLLAIEWVGSSDLSCVDCLNPTFTGTETTRLQLRVTDENGCSATASILLIVDQTVPIFIPNAFSPDRLDGANDFFTIYGDANQVAEIRQMKIFDRWGGLVFAKDNFPINNPGEGWNGTYNGTSAIIGVYVYWAELALQNGKSKIVEGDVLLLR